MTGVCFQSAFYIVKQADFESSLYSSGDLRTLIDDRHKLATFFLDNL